METKAVEPRLLDIDGAVKYLKSVGADSATPWWVRNLMSSGRIPFERIGRKHYVSKVTLDGFLAKAERKAR
jgi:hypothetical protein